MRGGKPIGRVRVKFLDEINIIIIIQVLSILVKHNDTGLRHLNLDSLFIVVSI